MDESNIRYAREYLGISKNDSLTWAMIRAGMGSVAKTFVGQMQDYLELGADCRMNKPGTASGNWRWRLLPGEFTDELVETVRRYTELYGRM